MVNHHSKLSEWASRALSVLRIVAACLILLHGTRKPFGVLMPPQAQAQQFALLSLVGVAGVLEFLGGLFYYRGFLRTPAGPP